MDSLMKSSTNAPTFRLNFKLTRINPRKPGQYKPTKDAIWCSKSIDLAQMHTEAQQMLQRLIEKVGKSGIYESNSTTG